MPAFHLLKRDARDSDVVVPYLLNPLFNYVEKYWINHPRGMTMSFYNSVIRTNNACESHNRMLARHIRGERPNVFIFIEALAKLENNCYLDIGLLAEGGSPSRTRRWSAVANDRKLKALAKDFQNQVQNAQDNAIRNYLKRAIFCFSSAFDELSKSSAT